MQIRRLRLVNFRQHADTVLDFEPGLTGIIGPNGAGKSTLLEAVAWAMYGTSAARGTRDSIRRRTAPPRSRVEVELDFVLGAHRYRVARSLQTAALFQDGEAAPIANSSGAVTDKVTRLLGMTRDEFFNTYFTGQKELAIMASMTAPERGRFLSRVLGYERLATVQVKLKEERTGIKAALQTAEVGLVDLAVLDREEAEAAARIVGADRQMAVATAGRQSVEESFLRTQPAWEEIQRRREEVQTIETDLNIAVHSAVEARRAFEALDLDLTESLAAKSRRDELAPELATWAELTAARERLDAEALAFSGRRALDAQLTEVRTQLDTLRARLAELPDPARLEAARTQLATAQAAAERLGAEREDHKNRWVRDREHATTRRHALQDQLTEAREQLTRLKTAGKDWVCPTCGKPIGLGYETVLEELETRLAEIINDGKHFRARMDQLAQEPEVVAVARRAAEEAEKEARRLAAATVRLEQGLAERDRASKAVEELTERERTVAAKLADTPTGYDEAEHRRVRERLLALEPIHREVVRLTARAERAADLVPKAAEAEQHLSRIEARVATLRAQLSGLGWAPERFDELRLAFQRVEQDRQAAEVALVRAQGERSAAIEHQAHVARRREERNQRAAEVDRLRGEQLFNQELDRAFTDLRDELNATLRPDLAEAASALLGDLTGGRYTDLELDDDYVPTIVDDGEPKQVISGGEEDVANLAIRLAISQMIADRAGQPFSLLILDEVFGSLDEERRAAVVSLLRGLADRFPQVILITHIESVRDGFDRIIRIDFDVEQGVATAREERLIGEEVSHVAA